jgi:hypothetical protein
MANTMHHTLPLNLNTDRQRDLHGTTKCIMHKQITAMCLCAYKVVRFFISYYATIICGITKWLI